jgi:protein-S-isoprenylcysteine O-methyltransferase Ste14
MKSLENRIPPPLLVLVTGAEMAASMVSEPIPASLFARASCATAIFLIAGFFGFPAVLAFYKAKTTINPVRIDQASRLVTTGIFSLSRNPMYVALTLLLFAWAAWLARPLAAIGPIAFAIFIDRFQIQPEERLLQAKFNGDYSSYRRSVRRWL